jgi:3D (Asp-Asp-Asp) domain-containing protein
MRAVAVAVLFFFLAGAACAAPLYPFKVKASAYCACEICCGKWSKYGLTKSGRRPTPGRTIAADTRVFPLGSCLRIGSTRYVVEDIGSAIKGLRVDIFHDSHEAAIKFGRQELIATLC